MKKTQYDKIAKDYSSSNRTEHPQRKYMIYPSWLKECGNLRGLHVLDLGCGGGYSSQCLAQNDAIVTGIDESPEQIRIARMKECENPLGIKYFVASAGNLPKGFTGKFDLVAAAYLFHYAKSEDELLFFVKESFRVLRGGGRVVAINQSPIDPVGKFIEGVSSHKVKWLDEPYGDGSRTEISLIGKDGERVCKPFVTYHWKQESYEKCFHEAGFADVKWLNLNVSEEGKKALVNWSDFEQQRTIVILTAKKP